MSSNNTLVSALIPADVGDVIEDQQVVFIELGERAFEGERSTFLRSRCRGVDLAIHWRRCRTEGMDSMEVRATLTPIMFQPPGGAAQHKTTGCPSGPVDDGLM
jgi:hypothetical protein